MFIQYTPVVLTLAVTFCVLAHAGDPASERHRRELHVRRQMAHGELALLPLDLTFANSQSVDSQRGKQEKWWAQSPDIIAFEILDSFATEKAIGCYGDGSRSINLFHEKLVNLRLHPEHLKAYQTKAQERADALLQFARKSRSASDYLEVAIRYPLTHSAHQALYMGLFMAIERLDVDSAKIFAEHLNKFYSEFPSLPKQAAVTGAVLRATSKERAERPGNLDERVHQLEKRLRQAYRRQTPNTWDSIFTTTKNQVDTAASRGFLVAAPGLQPVARALLAGDVEGAKLHMLARLGISAVPNHLYCAVAFGPTKEIHVSADNLAGLYDLTARGLPRAERFRLLSRLLNNTPSDNQTLVAENLVKDPYLKHFYVGWLASQGKFQRAMESVNILGFDNHWKDLVQALPEFHPAHALELLVYLREVSPSELLPLLPRVLRFAMKSQVEIGEINEFLDSHGVDPQLAHQLFDASILNADLSDPKSYQRWLELSLARKAAPNALLVHLREKATKIPLSARELTFLVEHDTKNKRRYFSALRRALEHEADLPSQTVSAFVDAFCDEAGKTWGPGLFHRVVRNASNVPPPRDQIAHRIRLMEISAIVGAGLTCFDKNGHIEDAESILSALPKVERNFHLVTYYSHSKSDRLMKRLMEASAISDLADTINTRKKNFPGWDATALTQLLRARTSTEGLGDVEPEIIARALAASGPLSEDDVKFLTSGTDAFSSAPLAQALLAYAPHSITVKSWLNEAHIRESGKRDFFPAPMIRNLLLSGTPPSELLRLAQQDPAGLAHILSAVASNPSEAAHVLSASPPNYPMTELILEIGRKSPEALESIARELTRADRQLRKPDHSLEWLARFPSHTEEVQERLLAAPFDEMTYYRIAAAAKGPAKNAQKLFASLDRFRKEGRRGSNTLIGRVAGEVSMKASKEGQTIRWKTSLNSKSAPDREIAWGLVSADPAYYDELRKQGLLDWTQTPDRQEAVTAQVLAGVRILPDRATDLAATRETRSLVRPYPSDLIELSRELFEADPVVATAYLINRNPLGGRDQTRDLDLLLGSQSGRSVLTPEQKKAMVQHLFTRASNIPEPTIRADIREKIRLLDPGVSPE